MVEFLQARLQNACAAGRVIAAALAMLLGAPLASLGASQLVGEPAADFALRSLGGGNLRLSEQLGDVVMLNFWASWCGPCREEMPQLDKIYARYRRAGFVLLGVNIDDEPERATEMARTLKVSYPVLFDQRQEVAKSFEVGILPVSVLIDRAGVVRYVSDDYQPGYEKRYTEQLRELLNE